MAMVIVADTPEGTRLEILEWLRWHANAERNTAKMFKGKIQRATRSYAADRLDDCARELERTVCAANGALTLQQAKKVYDEDRK